MESLLQLTKRNDMIDWIARSLGDSMSKNCMDWYHCLSIVAFIPLLSEFSAHDCNNTNTSPTSGFSSHRIESLIPHHLAAFLFPSLLLSQTCR